LTGLVGTFDIIQDSVQVYYDNESAIYPSKDHKNHKWTKHIDVRYHMIRHWVIVEMVINLVKISTKKNLANMITKTIPVEKFRASLNFINIL